MDGMIGSTINSDHLSQKDLFSVLTNVSVRRGDGGMNE
jgi:hypothetical protein